MNHDVTLIATLAAGFGLALVLGLVAVRLRLPALVGYLVAGVAIGPFTPGYVADSGLAGQLAEIGVMLLMFGVGLHFSLDDLLAVRRIAVPGAVVQMALATVLGAGLATLWGWPFGGALVFGLCLSVASTVVLLRALQAQQAVDTLDGRIAVGWLVVEDLAMVIVLVLLPAVAGLIGGQPAPGARDGPVWIVIGQTLLQVVAFVLVMLVVGRRVLPWLLWQVSRSGSRELFTLAVVASAIGIAFAAAQLFHVSFALGAFFAGMVLRESEFSHRAAEESLPLRDAFAVLFFVSVGMLFDPMVLMERPLQVLGTLAIVVIGKATAALALVRLFRYPMSTAMRVSVSLAQIGEFSFILAALGMDLGLMPREAMSLVVAAALISIAINPFLMAVSLLLARRMEARSGLGTIADGVAGPLAQLPSDVSSSQLSGHVVLVGHGRVGRRIAADLQRASIAHVIVERNRESVERLREQSLLAVSGDAADSEVLIQAHVARAALLVIAIADTVGLDRMVNTAKTLNPSIEIVVRSHHDEESALLREAGIGQVFSGDEELAKSMVAHVRRRFEVPAS